MNFLFEQRAADAENSLEKIKRHLASGSGRNLLQGPLLKRSETVGSRSLPFVFLLLSFFVVSNYFLGLDFGSCESSVFFFLLGQFLI